VSNRSDVTIYAVAQRAGVSISTVSLAINQPHRVSEATRAKVVRAAGELGYRPGATPSDRAKSRTGRIVVLAPVGSNGSDRQRLLGVLDAAERAKVEVVVHDAPPAVASRSPLMDALPLRGAVDGIIVMGVPLTDSVAGRLRDFGPPTVLVDSHSEGFSNVLFDDDEGGYLAGRHLVDRGHRDIAFLHERQESFDYVSAGMSRLSGLRRALAEAGGEAEGYRCRLIDVGTGEVGEVRQTAEATLGAATDRPTAVFANHDLIAAGFLLGARGVGAAVPADIAVIGFDDGLLAQTHDLTTVRQPLRDAGAIATDLLLSLIDAPGRTPQRVVLRGELVIRATT
jgi:DNA-binding LacI/PurR family transcriptional regulator